MIDELTDAIAVITGLRARVAALEAERLEWCEKCGHPLSDCGPQNPDGTPSQDCKVCQLTRCIAALEAERDQWRSAHNGLKAQLDMLKAERP